MIKWMYVSVFAPLTWAWKIHLFLVFFSPVLAGKLISSRELVALRAWGCFHLGNYVAVVWRVTGVWVALGHGFHLVCIVILKWLCECKTLVHVSTGRLLKFDDRSRWFARMLSKILRNLSGLPNSTRALERKRTVQFIAWFTDETWEESSRIFYNRFKESFNILTYVRRIG